MIFSLTVAGLTSRFVEVFDGCAVEISSLRGFFFFFFLGSAWLNSELLSLSLPVDNAHRSICTNTVQCENDLSSTYERR